MVSICCRRRRCLKIRVRRVVVCVNRIVIGALHLLLVLILRLSFAVLNLCIDCLDWRIRTQCYGFLISVLLRSVFLCGNLRHVVLYSQLILQRITASRRLVLNVRLRIRRRRSQVLKFLRSQLIRQIHALRALLRQILIRQRILLLLIRLRPRTQSRRKRDA